MSSSLDTIRQAGAIRRGLLVIGCSPACGKTVTLTGLAATLSSEGFSVKAIKPVSLNSRQDSAAELNFISSISRSPLDYPVQYAESGGITEFQWNEAVRICRSDADLTLVELPGCPTSPLCSRSRNGNWKDVSNLASDLGCPAILVAREGPDAMEKLILNSFYLACRQVPLIGLVTAETDKPAAEADQKLGPLDLPTRSLALTERTGVQFLGCLSFSPSINVPKVCQGNLIKTTETGLDLLPIIKALNLRISV